MIEGYTIEENDYGEWVIYLKDDPIKGFVHLETALFYYPDAPIIRKKSV